MTLSTSNATSYHLQPIKLSPSPLQLSVLDESNAPSRDRECNDFFFVLLFLTVVIATIVFAVKDDDDFTRATNLKNLQDSLNVKYLLHIVGLSAVASVCLSIIWITVMVILAKLLIWVTLMTLIGLNIGAIVLLTKQTSDNTFDRWPLVVFGSIALLATLYVYCIRKRINFAASHLQVAGNAIMQLPMTLIVALMTSIGNIGWTALWILGSLEIMFHQDYITTENPCTVEKCRVKYEVGATIVGVLLLTYFWVTFVLRNIIGVTTAGSIAAWRNSKHTPLITIRAWLRAMTLNLGSICIGSLIVAILETIVWMLRGVVWLTSYNGNCCLSCLLACLSCIISGLEKWVECFNRFAFSYVGCYGYSFVTASGYTFQLFASKGWSAIVNDDLMGTVSWLGNLSVGAVTAYTGVQIVNMTDSVQLAMFPQPQLLVAFLCFIAGYSVNNIVMAVVTNAVTTVFVLWAEDPHGWQLTHPTHYETLHKAWLTMYPNEYNNGRGKNVAQDNIV